LTAYLVALALTAAVLALRALADPFLGDDLPFITLFAAVAAVVWYGGWGPALLTTVLGCLGSYYFFIGPRSSFAGEFVRLTLYLLTCSVIIALGEVMRTAQRRSTVAQELLQLSEDRFRTLADQAPVLIWMNDQTGCEYVNRSYLEFVGMKLEQVRGMNWSSYVHEEDRDGGGGGTEGRGPPQG
jgi:PAS domain-containing protein